MNRGKVRGVVVLALLLSTSACSEEFVAPTTRAECARAAPDHDTGGGGSDAGSVWTMAYSQDGRPLGSGLTLYVCAPAQWAAVVTIDAVPGIEADPEPLVMPASTSGLDELRITVTDDVDDGEPLRVTYDSDGGGGTMSVEVEVDDGEWSLHPR